MKQITFSLPVEALGEATEALLLGDFNNWNPVEAAALTMHKDGTYKVDLLLEPGKTYEYRYFLNDGRWINDHKAQSYARVPDFNIENSVITIPDDVVMVEETIITVSKVPAKKAKTTKAKTTAPKEKKAVKPETKAAKPEEKPKKDDLTKIEGIGPKIAQLLEADGITDFKDLSKTTAKKLKAILDAAGPKFKMHEPTSWPKQAKLAAAGKWEKLAELQDELKGGK